MNILQLMVQLGIKGADKVESALGSVEQQAHGAAHGVKHAGEEVEHAEAKFEHFEFAALEAVFALQQFVSIGKETIEVLTEFTGLADASAWNHLSNSIQNVTGSAEAARDMLKEVKEMASATGFNAQDFAKIAPELLNAGVPQGQVVDQLQSLANLAAKGNLGRAEMPEFLEQMVKMRDMDHPMIKQLIGMSALPIKDLVNAGAGTHFKTANQADDFLAGTGRGQGYDILLKGVDIIGKDAAALQKVNEPAMALAKTFETLEEVMEPTGQLLLKVLGPVGVALGWVAEQLEHLNAITGGSAGLVAIIMLLIRNHTLLISSFRAAIRWTRELTEAVERYGAAAEAASLATGGIHGGGGSSGEGVHAYASTSGAAEGKGHAVALLEADAGVRAAQGVHSAAGGGGVLHWVKEQTRIIKELLKFTAAHPGSIKELGMKLGPILAHNAMENIKGIGRMVGTGEVFKLAKLAKVADIATFAAGIGLEALGDHMRDKNGNQTRAGAITTGVGEGIGYGGLGFLAGPWVGLAGTLISGVIGGVVGNRHFKYDEQQRYLEERKNKALEENTNALLDLKGKMIGSGERGRRMAGQLQVERSLAMAVALGLG